MSPYGGRACLPLPCYSPNFTNGAARQRGCGQQSLRGGQFALAGAGACLWLFFCQPALQPVGVEIFRCHSAGVLQLPAFTAPPVQGYFP